MDAVLAALREGGTAVTANNRLARSIKLAYNRQRRTQGCRAWHTPQVVPWRAWIGELWSLSVAHGGDAGRRTLLTDPQAGALWRDVVRGAGAAPLPGTVSPVAELAGRAWRICQDWRLTPAMLLSAADSEDSRAFAALAGAFQQRCEADGWADSGMLLPLLARDAQCGQLGGATHIHLVGFDDWTPAQRELLRVIVAAGWTVTDEPVPRAAASHACQVSCRDSAHELEMAARWARWRLEQDPESRIGIVVPDLAARVPEARRLVLDVFAPDWRLARMGELPVNFSCGEPLLRTGLVHAALLVLRALSGELDYHDAGQLLRTPYLGDSSAEEGARALLDLWLRECIGTSVGIAGLAARAGDSAPRLATRLSLLAAAAGALPRRQTASAWAGTFREALQAVGWPGDRPLASDEYQAAMAWQEQLEALRACDRIAGVLSLEGALGLLGSLAGNQLFQPAGHPDGVQVLGTLEAAGQRFDGLWICGLTSAAWPPAARPDPLIPLALQRELRMPDSSAPAARERAERLLRGLEASAPEVVVSWPEFSGEEPLSPTPLIAHLPVCAVTGLRLWDTPDRRTAMAASRATVLLCADPAPAVDPAHPPRGGATLLERQARCPARAFLEFRLGARDLHTPAVGIDAAKRGAIIHGALQDFFTQITSHAQLLRLTDENQIELLDSIIRQRLAKELPMADPLVRRIARHERTRLHRMLGEFLRLERERAEFDVLATEAELAAEGAPAEIAALGIRPRADRVDQLAGGDRLIIDYKTGRSLPSLLELCGPRPRSPQLPLYATLADAQGIAFVQLTAVGIDWLAIGMDSLPITGLIAAEQLTKSGAASWGELRAQWWTALQRIAGEILAGDFRIDRRHRKEAEGQWAMATRVHELPDDEEGEA